MQLFYTPGLKCDTTSHTFDKEESRHIVKVMRKNAGDTIYATNGLGDLFTAEVILPSDTRCNVRVISAEKQPPLPYRLHMAVAPTKMNERFEWFLEKATEIGISEVTPIICDHSERTTLKIDRMEKIILSAMKQSESCYLPKLHAPISFREFLGADRGKTLIAHCYNSERHPIKKMVSPGENITILIGPEGDFSENEVKLATGKGCIPISLGHTRLRTETAAVVACHSIAFING